MRALFFAFFLAAGYFVGYALVRISRARFMRFVAWGGEKKSVGERGQFRLNFLRVCGRVIWSTTQEEECHAER